MSVWRLGGLITIGCSLAIGLPGCGGTMGGPGGPLASRGSRYCLQSGAIGGAVGGLGGALAGRAIAGSHNNTMPMVIGGLLGAAAGAFTTCSYGVWVANKRQGYENEQARLAGELNNSRQTNQSLTELNQQLASDLSTRRQELADLKAASVSSQLQANQKQQLASQLDQAHKAAEQQLATAKEELDQHKQELASLEKEAGQIDNQQLSDYKRQVADLEQSVKQLDDLTQQYAKASGTAQRL